ncbi:hypothetical protein [Arthrobacter sp. U41]|uniref:hypothetical protein n=1 Tax=Arthrobacter sp. U41 TaxID=1849032 RepID=UPI0018D3173C|nr:hypothetical protein [Arthrobacter sp. U41]
MDTITPAYARLRSAVTERLNAHDLPGVMDHGAPEPPSAKMAALAAGLQAIHSGFVQS